MRITFIALAYSLLLPLGGFSQSPSDYSWRKIPQSVVGTTGFCTDACFIDDQRIIVSSYHDSHTSYLRLSNDGGASWRPFWDKRRSWYGKMHFFDAENGILLGREGVHIGDSEWIVRTMNAETVGPTTLRTGLSIDHNGGVTDPVTMQAFPGGIAYVNVYRPGVSQVMMQTRDAGRTWDTAFVLNDTSSSTCFNCERKVVQMAVPELGYIVHILDGMTAAGPFYRFMGLSRTEDNGRTWHRIDDALFERFPNNYLYLNSDISGTLVLTPRPDLLYIVSRGGTGIVRIDLKRKEAGYTQLTLVEDMVGPNRIFGTIDIEFINDEVGFMLNGFERVTSNEGEYPNLIAYTTDRGKTWKVVKNVEGDPRDAFMKRINMLNDRTGIFFSTECHLYVTRTGGITSTAAARLVGSEFNLYPNPASGEFTIELSLAQNSPVQVELIDLTGRRAALLHDQVLTAGSHALKFTPVLTAGLYFCRIHADDKSTVQRLVWLD